MKILNKIQNFFGQKKSYTSSWDNILSFYREYNSLRSYRKISNLDAIVYYLIVSTVNHGTTLISDEYKSIDPIIYNNIANKKEENIGKEVLDLLYNPNKDDSKNTFMEKISIFRIVTGNVYIVAIGEKTPLELFVIPSQNVLPSYDSKGMYTDYYDVNINNGTIRFNKKYLGNEIVYIDSSGGRQLYHIKKPNPLSEYCFEGLSSLNSLYYEIETYIESSVHNLSLLKRGVKTSGVIFLDTELTIEQYERYKQQLSDLYSGAENAGKAMIFDTKGDFKSLMQNAQDMDYKGLRSDIRRAIYNNLKVPLAMVNTEEMAQATAKEAKLTLYDNAVLPLTNTLYAELSKFLFPRFKIDIKKYSLWYNEGDIPALVLRRNEEILKIQKSGVATINELRALYGLPEIEGGNILYQPLNLIPVGTAQQQQQQQQDNKSMKERYIAILRKYKDTNGNRLYSDDKVEELAQKHFGS